MKTIVLPILLFLFVADTCFAQKKQLIADTTLAGKWFTEANLLPEENNYEEGRAVFCKAAELYKKHKQWNKLSDCYTTIIIL